MQFLANENFPIASVRLLRKYNFDIVAIAEIVPGSKDSDVLAFAKEQNRIILTFDRDYGELIYRYGLPNPPGILYFRFTPITPEQPANYVIDLIQKQNIILENKFTVADLLQIRQRNLPNQ